MGRDLSTPGSLDGWGRRVGAPSHPVGRPALRPGRPATADAGTGRARPDDVADAGSEGCTPYPGRVTNDDGLTAVPDLETLRAMGPAQQPAYPDPAAVDAAVARLRRMPPLVFAGECDELKAKLADVAHGKAFLLQGGDCAETFEGATADNVRNKLRVLLQMAVVLTYAASVPVVKLGRLAGQYAKPRSSDLETREGVTLPAYRGDAVNGFDFTPEARIPDPQRLIEAYHSSASTLNLVRAFVTGGYADLRQVHTWNTDFVVSSAGRQALREDRPRDRPGDELHVRDRRRPRRVPPGRLPHLPRGAAARVRARDDAHRQPHRHAVRRLGPLRLDRRAHQRPRRRPRRAAQPGPQPDRRQGRPALDARRPDRPRRQAQPRQRGRPAHLHHPDGRRPDPRRPARR